MIVTARHTWSAEWILPPDATCQYCAWISNRRVIGDEVPFQTSNMKQHIHQTTRHKTMILLKSCTVLIVHVSCRIFTELLAHGRGRTISYRCFFFATLCQSTQPYRSWWYHFRWYQNLWTSIHGFVAMDDGGWTILSRCHSHRSTYCSDVSNLIPHNVALRLMVKLPDEENSWNSYCVILFSKSDIWR